MGITRLQLQHARAPMTRKEFLADDFAGVF